MKWRERVICLQKAKWYPVDLIAMYPEILSELVIAKLKRVQREQDRKSEVEERKVSQLIFNFEMYEIFLQKMVLFAGFMQLAG